MTTTLTTTTTTLTTRPPPPRQRRRACAARPATPAWSPGTVSRCGFPQRPDIDVLAAVDTGTVVSPYYDSLVAQVVCHGKDRADTIARMRSYLDQVTIEGVCTNLPLLRRVLDDEQFRTGDYDTRYLPGFLARTSGSRSGAFRRRLRDDGSCLDRDRGQRRTEGPRRRPAASSLPLPRPTIRRSLRVGDVLGTDKTLCLIEAMKLFRPVSLSSIDAGGDLFARDTRYEVMRVNAANGQVVNQGDLLFVVRPVAA